MAGALPKTRLQEHQADLVLGSPGAEFEGSTDPLSTGGFAVRSTDSALLPVHFTEEETKVQKKKAGFLGCASCKVLRNQLAPLLHYIDKKTEAKGPSSGRSAIGPLSPSNCLLEESLPISQVS